MRPPSTESHTRGKTIARQGEIFSIYLAIMTLTNSS